ncbi:aldehyde dehydrogenase domain-containing protein [Entophlyctis helioformis]|nr:aldehyde dehydrogenase domain-containing protein [Entophlyctis helioformis]
MLAPANPASVLDHDIKTKKLVDPKTVHADLHYKGKTYNVPTGLFINNQFVPSVSGKKFPAVNPATGKHLLEFFEGDKADVDAAVKAAKAAFKTWAKTPSADRGRLLYKLADLMERDIRELAELESLDNGKPVKVALAADLPLSIGCLRYYAGWADKNHGQVVDVPPTSTPTRSTSRTAFAGCAALELPSPDACLEARPSLACGNTVVVKTSEKTPMTSLKVAQLAVEAGFPAGVINIISGYGPTAGDAIARHPEISKIAFTGSTAVGRKIAVAAAETNLKKVTLELGGKSPNIVFPDADLDLAVKAATGGIFFNAGQCCCAGSRVYVHEDVYDEFVAKFKEATSSIKLGDPFDESSDQGALVDDIQFNRVLDYIDIGRREGATIEVGGDRVGTEGFYVQPTLITDVSDDMRIAKEEIFGPVVCALKFKTVDEVIERANNSIYGLAAGIHTKDIRTALRMSEALQAGTVWINCYNIFLNQMPFGGFKQSGAGRELGSYGLQEYTQIKSVMINLA